MIKLKTEELDFDEELKKKIKACDNKIEDILNNNDIEIIKNNKNSDKSGAFER